MRKSEMRMEVRRLMEELRIKPHLWGMSPVSEKLVVEALGGVDKFTIDLPDGLQRWEFNNRLAALQRFVVHHAQKV